MVIPAGCWAGLWIACKIHTWLNEHCGWRTHFRGDVADGLVFHADRRTQFTSEKLWEVCRNLGVAQSVGRTGVCFDNAMAESFWSTLKTEFYDRKRWPTRDTARQAVAYWIEVVYNRRRRH
ncbi:integrase core domain-containing protein [Corynebacterium rhinophilum]|uniref:integrase core domain-containing protein n=1 Tax=Corynebacterium rhinophilum TaxID=3050197 RepID=UPI0039799F05